MLTSFKIPLSPEVEEVILTAQNKAREYQQAKYTPSHVIWSMIRNDSVSGFINQLGKNPHSIMSWAELRIENTPKSAKTVDIPTEDDAMENVLQEAYRIRTLRVEKEVTPITLLEAISTPDIAFKADQLKRYPLTLAEIQSARNKQSELINELYDSLSNGGKNTDGDNNSNANAEPSNNKSLDKYCENISLRAKAGKIDPVIGRDKELKQLTEILGKRLSPNVLIVGESGVGKTAIVGGLALNILSGKVPERLKSSNIYELDVNGRLVAGAFKGEVESRLKETLTAIKSKKGAILFIDEIHSILDPNGSVGSGAANLLKPELARGELTVIGATTETEYREYFENDSAFKRRFTILRIDEPSEKLAVQMLQGLTDRYEKFHGVSLLPDTLPLAVQLAKRYMADKRLPTSALEIIDVTMAATKVMNDTNKNEISVIENEIKQIEDSTKSQAEKDIDLKGIDTALDYRLSHLLSQKLKSVSDIKTLNQKIDRLKEWTIEPAKSVGSEDIAATIAYLTGIPMGKIQSEEQKQLLDLENQLRKRVVGQDHALKVVAEALRRSRSGLRESNKPSAAFFFLGPTGTGKTELTKTIAEYLFNDMNALIRFDMSEFKEEHSAALLYGSPPGYVGYKEGGLLVNKIRQRPYAVVLFDEIEKAHKSVYDVFLQILDEGQISDKQGKKGDFTKSVVIFTSNIGSEWIIDQYKQGHTPTRDQLREVMADARMPDGTKAFRPELLGRGMQLIPFAPISESVALEILEIHLKNFSKLLSAQGIEFSWSEAAKKQLIKIGFSPLYGARPLKDTIEDRIATPISDKIIGGTITKGYKVEVDHQESNEEFIWNIH